MSDSTTSTVSFKNGDELDVKMLSNDVVREASALLKKNGIVVRVGGDQTYEEQIAFQNAIARVCIVEYRAKKDDGFNRLSVKEVAALLDKHPNVCAAVVSHAKSLQDAYNDPYEIDASN